MTGRRVAAFRGAWGHRRTIGRVAAGLQQQDCRPLVSAIRTLPLEEQQRATMRLLDGHTILEFERAGISWRTDAGDEIGESLYVTGAYEADEIAAVMAHLPGHGTIVDLGANIGTTAIPFAQAGYDVIAVEPVPATFDMLVRNIETNGFGDQVRCVNAAVTEGVGPIEMWTGFGSGQGEIAVDAAPPAMTRFGDRGELVTVQGCRLDEIVQEATLVWADVQGSETAVIRTGVGLWASGVPLYLEVDPEALDTHAGLAVFIGAVEAHFTSFLTRSDLLGGVQTIRPIGEFDAWVHTIPANRYEDALLKP